MRQLNPEVPVADFQRDELENFAPTRRIDRGADPRAARPEWLTATGRPEGKGFPAGIDNPVTAHEPARPRPSAPEGSEGESWENAVGRAEGEPAGPEPTIRIYKKWSLPQIRGLQSALGALSKSQPLVFVALAVIAVVALMMFRPRDEQTVSIAAIHHHPERFEGRPVKVRGRVGDVYEVGGGYAFYLRQGREDIVVFTRSRVPVRREEVTISGSISTGVLDGKSRQALFETAP
jgi:hypothetical protein